MLIVAWLLDTIITVEKVYNSTMNSWISSLCRLALIIIYRLISTLQFLLISCHTDKKDNTFQCQWTHKLWKFQKIELNAN